ncbi:MAG: hypothetical protein IGNPGNKH_00730 [Sodalis sp. Ffu]|nr:MAG: hypothetical protein IGNPGNKH_00730 [Sodalis sp. Ffu]
MRNKINTAIIAILLLFTSIAFASKLAIVIDDFGYRPATENQVLKMPINISIAVLPDAPHAREMATKAYLQGREVLIHLPMAPLSKQSLERNTLSPEMSLEEMARIIREAVNKVPYASGLNNHMGSAMTSSLRDMRNVMRVLSHYDFYFLDSMTIGNSQSLNAAAETGVQVIKRNVFLDDAQNEADIRRQFNRAVMLARRNGSAIAIGHPHPTTVRILQQILPLLPVDIMLVRPSLLLNEKSGAIPFLASDGKSTLLLNQRFRCISLCVNSQVSPLVYANIMLSSFTDKVQNTLHKILSSKIQSLPCPLVVRTADSFIQPYGLSSPASILCSGSFLRHAYQATYLLPNRCRRLTVISWVSRSLRKHNSN